MGNLIDGVCFECKGKGFSATKTGSKYLTVACTCPAGAEWGRRMADVVAEVLGEPDAVVSPGAPFQG